MAINNKQTGDKGFVFFYNQQRIEVYAPTLLEAKERAVTHFKPPKSKRHMVHGMLAEAEDGSPVTHVAD